ncbi:MAG: hypothetical protein LBI18_04120, partial [Planctomycetaceae bacterium]|jgi:hypothetical protein|nr:hypothetical protein [Planctomycetaceae bacterium]
MLSYYVVLHLRQAWASHLYCDDNLDETRENRDPVITAKPTKKVAAKKARNKKIKVKTESSANEENNNEYEQVQRFQTLLNNLATICKNDCQIENENNINFNSLTTPTPFQEILLKQIKSINLLSNS